MAKTTAVNHPNYKALETQGSWLSTLGLCLFKETVPSIGPETPRYSATGYCGIESINQGSQMGSWVPGTMNLSPRGRKDQYKLRSRHSIIVPDNSVSFYFHLEICWVGFQVRVSLCCSLPWNSLHRPRWSLPPLNASIEGMLHCAQLYPGHF